MTILDQIVEDKRAEIATQKKSVSVEQMRRDAEQRRDTRQFREAVVRTASHHPAIIAEIKRGSPSLGCAHRDLDVVSLAQEYQAGGAAALSVLTDRKHFFATASDFAQVRQAQSLPMLRKEFIVDEYQVYESRVLGADCILLIMAILSVPRAVALAQAARELQMDVLVEAHTGEELRAAVAHVPYDLIGINNRDLRTFQTAYERTLDLADLVPDRSRLVAESGLKDPESIRHLWAAGIRIFLIGEAFITSRTPRVTVHHFVHCHEYITDQATA